MEKESKPRANKYEEKVSFKGSLDDISKLSALHAEIKKLNIGDIIERDGKSFKVLETKFTDENIPDGYLLMLEDIETGKKFFSN